MRKMIFILACFLTLNVGAQETINNEKLKEYSWKLDLGGREGKDVTYTYSFTSDSLILCVHIIDRDATEAYPYYFADEEQTIFDDSKVGKKTTGKYIVHKENKVKHPLAKNDLYNWEIKEQSDDRLLINIVGRDLEFFRVE